ncbi:hypothetical protein [Clostridium sp. CCUG 7971]|uniref:hypothetical protein n=1 Tax=Clostridium sp. CCUG 7971 TaxID=2811414 RepID=UPI001ABBC6AF|nr:hypothetical protein [Clostridium sp. CCUG 7971]MBO3445031.1 hypothetical protein [Clostridium sp. CCUG 7971]
MIKICSMCSGISIDELKARLGGEVEIEDGCIYECGSELTAYSGEELITADSENELIEALKKA